MNELIDKILKERGIDPNTIVQTDNGQNTAFGIMENWIAAALDAIEEGTNDETQTD
tara:strand:- start:2613 stop:2780 length:168 start_codon:yes stop_codon:yes gene_type:complete